MGAKVTTKNGDTGTTRTLGGDIVSKSDIIIECSGWVDSARAQTALLRQLILENNTLNEEAEFLNWLLHCYFLIGCEVNDPENIHPEYRPCIFDEHFLKKLEHEQDSILKNIELPNAFIVSASSFLSAQCDVLSTIVRTLERKLVILAEEHPDFNREIIIPFINRLSDYFFILARHLEKGDYQVVDYNILKQI